MRSYLEHSNMQSKEYKPVPGGDRPKALLDYVTEWQDNSDDGIDTMYDLIGSLEDALRAAIKYPKKEQSNG